jgi:hypothetical protein
MADLALTPIIGSPCRVYPRDDGKVVGPNGVPDNEGGVAVSVSKVSGTGGAGTYQPQQSDSADGPWENVGAALGTGTTSVAVKAAYVRVVPATEPDSGTSTRVCIRTDVE